MTKREWKRRNNNNTNQHVDETLGNGRDDSAQPLFLHEGRPAVFGKEQQRLL